MLDIVVTQKVKPGMENAFEALAKEVEQNTLAKDAGCLRYEWYRGSEPHTFILIERWVDEAAAQAHLKAPHLQALNPKIRECVLEKFAVNRLVRLLPD